MEDFAGWHAWVTFGIAVLGAALGVANLVRDLLDDRVRLRVVPAMSFPMGGPGLLRVRSGHGLAAKLEDGVLPTISVEVVNLSKFPVTIEEIGLCEVSPRRYRRQAVAILPPVLQGGTLPRRVEAREAATALFALSVSVEYGFTRRTVSVR
jgi:hypothetical protein